MIRLARKNPDERDALLTWAQELLEAGSGHDGPKGAPEGSAGYPLSIFRVYKHRRYDALLLRDFRVEMDGSTFASPSAAAIAISGHNENGWRAWKYTDPTSGRAVIIDRLRSPVA